MRVRPAVEHQPRPVSVSATEDDIGMLDGIAAEWVLDWRHDAVDLRAKPDSTQMLCKNVSLGTSNVRHGHAITAGRSRLCHYIIVDQREHANAEPRKLLGHC